MNIEHLKEFGIDSYMEGKLIIDLHSKWCSSCLTISPILEKFRDDGLINLIKINLDENRKLGRELEIHAVPTLLFFKDGKLLDKNIAVSGETLVDKGIMIGATGELILKEIIKQM